MLGRQRGTDGLEVVAGIEPFRDVDGFTERLAVTQERGARQHVDLGAGIVDVIFAGDVIARVVQEACQRIAENRAAAMADMHRPGRIGRDVFDIDLLARADAAFPIGRAFAQHGEQGIGPCRGFQGQIDEAGAGDINGGNQVIGAQPGRDRFGEVARLGFGLLGQNHRGIGSHVAMRRLLRGLDHHAREVDAFGQHGFRRERGADRTHAGKDVGKQMQRGCGIDHGLTSTRTCAGTFRLDDILKDG